MMYILLVVPPIVFAIAILQIRGPILSFRSFVDALKMHNDELVEALMEETTNATDKLLEGQTRLRLLMQGTQVGEEVKPRVVAHVALGAGDPSLSLHFEWVPVLTACIVVSSALLVLAAQAVTAVLDSFFAGKRDYEVAPWSTAQVDSIWWKRKAFEQYNKNRTLVKDTVKKPMLFETKIRSTSVYVPSKFGHSAFYVLLAVIMIFILSAVLYFAGNEKMAMNVAHTTRGALSLSPVPIKGSWGIVATVALIPIQVISLVAGARLVQAFVSVIFYFFGGDDKEDPSPIPMNL